LKVEINTLNPFVSSHQPVILSDPNSLLGDVLDKLTVEKEIPGNDVIDKDLISKPCHGIITR